MLRFTGHAFVDAGIIGMMIHAGKDHPDELSTDDLARIADWLAGLYTRPGSLRRHLHGMLFLNAGYYLENALLRDAFVRRVLYAWQAHAVLDETCIFCQKPAAYYANREELPLINGRGVINFTPNGVGGTPICGTCSLAIQMLPVVSVKSERLLMVITSGNPAITVAFARENYRQFRQFITLTDDAELVSLPYIRTRFVETCIRWMAKNDRMQKNASITAYCFTNYGANAEIQILRLDACVFGWLDEVLHHDDVSIQASWAKALTLGWTGTDDIPLDQRRNRLYEALLGLPQKPYEVLHYLKKTSHRGLLESFLIRIMDMSPQTIALLKQLGARFATYAQDHRRFFYDFLREDEYSPWRRQLLRAADDCKRRYGHPLITMDEFLEAFTTPDKEYNQWRLSRDLIALMMIELLDIDNTESDENRPE